MLQYTKCKQSFPSEAALAHHSSSLFGNSLAGKHRFSYTGEPLVIEFQFDDEPLPPNPSKLLEEHNPELFFGEFTTKILILNKNPSELDTSTFLKYLKPNICTILAEALQNHKQITFYISLYVNCTQEDDANAVTSNLMSQTKLFKSRTFALHSNTEIEDSVEILTTFIAKESNEQVSRCVINEIVHLEVNIQPLQEKKGKFIALPGDIVGTRSVVNVNNSDNYCFKWAIFSGIMTNLKPNLTTIATYGILDISQDVIEFSGMSLDFSGLHFPVDVWDTRIFEERNPNLSVNVFGLEIFGQNSTKIVGPLYRTKKEKATHINLLYIENEQEQTCHYACIREMSRILRKQFTYVNKRVYICNFCMKHFIDRIKYEKHEKCMELRVLK